MFTLEKQNETDSMSGFRGPRPNRAGQVSVVIMLSSQGNRWARELEEAQTTEP